MFLRARLRPADLNPVWIPTNPITLCLLTSPLTILFPATSQAILTVFGGKLVRQVRPDNRRAGKRIVDNPKRKPVRPIAREVKTIKGVDRRVKSDGRALNSLGEDGMILLTNGSSSYGGSTFPEAFVTVFFFVLFIQLRWIRVGSF